MSPLAGNALPPVAILGGYGFIGSHLAARLHAKGHPVTVFGRASAPLAGAPATPGLRRLSGDFASAAELDPALRGAEVVFHLVGETVPASSNADPLGEVTRSLVPTLALLRRCGELGVRQLVFASSGGTVYGVPRALPITEDHPTEPTCAYGVQKLTVEHYMRLYQQLTGVDQTVLRISNAYGPGQHFRRGQGVIGAFCRRIAAGEELQVWGDGSVVRDYLHVEDLVRAMECVIGDAPGFTTFNVGTGVGVSLRELLGLLQELAGEVRVGYQPARTVDVPANVLDASRFRARYGWQPERPLREGLREVLEWARSAR